MIEHVSATVEETETSAGLTVRVRFARGFTAMPRPVQRRLVERALTHALSLAEPALDHPRRPAVVAVPA